MKTVGAITIGQAPRDDIVPEIEKLLGPAVRVVQAGALDGASPAEIANFAAGPGQDTLTTRLRDGTEVLVAKPAIVSRLQACIDRLREADALVILCAGKFPPFHSRRPILLPERILTAAVGALFDGGRLGVIVPIPHQREPAQARWSAVDPRVAVTVASPYQDAGHLIDAAEDLRRAGASLILMNCLGFTTAMKAAVRDVAGVPTLLPSSLLARFLGEML